MRDQTILEAIEATLASAGVYNSGEIASTIFEGLIEVSVPLYRYKDDNDQEWYDPDFEGLLDSFGCGAEDVEGGYFMPYKL